MTFVSKLPVRACLIQIKNEKSFSPLDGIFRWSLLCHTILLTTSRKVSRFNDGKRQQHFFNITTFLKWRPSNNNVIFKLRLCVFETSCCYWSLTISGITTRSLNSCCVSLCRRQTTAFSHLPDVTPLQNAHGTARRRQLVRGQRVLIVEWQRSLHIPQWIVSALCLFWF